MKWFFIMTLAFGLCLWNGAIAQETDTLTAQVDSVEVTNPAGQVDVIAQKYSQKCAGCHTIGGGKLTGPDLLPTRVWPKAELADMVKLMEDRVGPLTDEEISEYVELLQDARAGDRVRIAQELASKAVAATLEPASKTIGQELFDGTTPLANGGVACITCHRAGAQGGSLGLDLTDLHTRMGIIAMTSAIQQAQFVVMAGTYKNKPITAQEAVHLAEYMSSPELMPASSIEDNAPTIGLVVGILSLLFIVGIFRNRSRHTMPRLRGVS